MSVERIAQYISEQVRKERALGLHGIHAFDEATERTAVKNELNKLGSALGELQGRQRTGVHMQTTSPKISTSHHSKDKVGKVLSAAGYKKVGQSAEHPNFPGRSAASYEKTDEHGFTHSVKHAFDTDNRHSVHHVGASKARGVNESTNDHIMISHPIETLHAGDNKNRTGRALTGRGGDFSKEYNNQEHHYNQILKKVGKHKDAKVHDGHEDEAGHISFKKGSAAHEAAKEHLQHVDHSPASHNHHKSGPNA